MGEGWGGRRCASGGSLEHGGEEAAARWGPASRQRAQQPHLLRLQLYAGLHALLLILQVLQHVWRVEATQHSACGGWRQHSAAQHVWGPC